MFLVEFYREVSNTPRIGAGAPAGAPIERNAHIKSAVAKLAKAILGGLIIGGATLGVIAVTVGMSGLGIGVAVVVGYLATEIIHKILSKSPQVDAVQRHPYQHTGLFKVFYDRQNALNAETESKRGEDSGVANNQEEIAKFFSQNPQYDVNTQDRNNRTVLYRALHSQKVDATFIKALIAKDAQYTRGQVEIGAGDLRAILQGDGMGEAVRVLLEINPKKIVAKLQELDDSLDGPSTDSLKRMVKNILQDYYKAKTDETQEAANVFSRAINVTRYNPIAQVLAEYIGVLSPEEAAKFAAEKVNLDARKYK